MESRKKASAGEDSVSHAVAATKSFAHQLEIDLRQKEINPMSLAIVFDIWKTFDDTPEKDQKDLIEKLRLEGCARVLAKYLDALTPKNGGNAYFKGKNEQSLYLVHLLCMMFSDKSLQFAADFGKQNVLPSIVQTLDVSKLGSTDQIGGSIVSFSLCTLYNCAKVPDNISHYRSANVAKALIPFTKVESPRKLVLVMMILAYITKENDNIPEDRNVIRRVLSYFKKCVTAYPTMYEGLNTKEVAAVLLQLSKNNKIKGFLVEEEFIKILLQFIPKGNDDEKRICVELIRTLAFNEEVRRKLLAQPLLITVLKDLQQASGQIKTYASGALKTLQTESRPTVAQTERQATTAVPESDVRAERSPARPPKMNKAFEDQSGGNHGKATGKSLDSEKSGGSRKDVEQHDIMISYQRRHERLMKRVKERLTNSGFSVWMDIDRMHETSQVLEGMSKAVENSAVVLICLSQEYKDSPDCKMEAGYAQKRRKPIVPLKVDKHYEPDGWLGLLVESKYYYDFSESTGFDSAMSRLLSGIGNILKRSMKDQPDCGSPPRPLYLDKDVVKWTRHDVASWAKSNGLESKAIFELDGRGVKTLARMNRGAEEPFYNNLERMGVTDINEITALEKALESLNVTK